MTDVCLTFDNGPDEVGTPRVLDVLERRGATAIFFVVGRQLERPGGLELAREVVARGHTIGHHTYSHAGPLGRDPRPDRVALELERTHRLLSGLWDGPRWFRPVGGGGRKGAHLLGPDVVDWLVAREYSCVLWSSVPGDFRDPVGWVERGLDDARRATRPLLMALHDHAREATERLDAFLTRLEGEGHRLVTDIPEDQVLIRDGRILTDLSPYTTTGAPAA